MSDGVDIESTYEEISREGVRIRWVNKNNISFSHEVDFATAVEWVAERERSALCRGATKTRFKGLDSRGYHEVDFVDAVSLNVIIPSAVRQVFIERVRAKRSSD